MSVLTNGLRILSVAQEWQFVVTGIIIILAVYADMMRRKQGGAEHFASFAGNPPGKTVTASGARRAQQAERLPVHLQEEKKHAEQED